MLFLDLRGGWKIFFLLQKERKRGSQLLNHETHRKLTQPPTKCMSSPPQLQDSRARLSPCLRESMREGGRDGRGTCAFICQRGPSHPSRKWGSNAEQITLIKMLASHFCAAAAAAPVKEGRSAWVMYPFRHSLFTNDTLTHTSLHTHDGCVELLDDGDEDEEGEEDQEEEEEKEILSKRSESLRDGWMDGWMRRS